jgi:thioredoxin 1
MNFKMKYLGYLAIGIFALIVIYLALKPEISFKTPGQETAVAASPATTAPSGRVTMLDLGATKCVPCKMMAPIIEELKKEYAGKADILFIDVWQNPDEARKYGIQAIPTQIFFDANGKEMFRNQGFMDKKRIVEALALLGVS